MQSRILQKLSRCVENHTLTLIFCVIVFAIVFQNVWLGWINDIWVIPVMSKLIGNEWWIALGYLMIVFLYYYLCWCGDKLQRIKYLIFWVVYAIIFFFCFFSGKWDYSRICNIPWVLLTILPLVCEIILFIRTCRTRNIDMPKAQLEVEKTENVSDSYKRIPMCDATYEILKTCYNDMGSFSVAITGAWGSGKTVFMNKLKDNYKNDAPKDNTSIIVFEPWKNDTPDAIVKSFFSLLRKETSDNMNLSTLIDEYVLTLLDENTKKPIQILSNLIKMSVPNKNNNPYQHIYDELAETKHRIVVFIDDIDRLNVDEIKEVLRLVRNTANFPYVQFITAYDRNYVINTLKKCNIESPTAYLEKFFNVEIVLPEFEKRVICHEVLVRVAKLVNDIWEIDEEDTRIRDMVFHKNDKILLSVADDYIVSKVLPTIRDVIRFCNSFKLTAYVYKKQGIETEVEFQELFYVELLKYRFNDVYTILGNHPLRLLEINDNYIYKLKDDGKKSIINTISEEYSDSEKEALKSILVYLFNSGNRKHSLCKVRDFNKYFMCRLDDKILTESEFLSLAGYYDNELLSYATKLYRNKYPFELENQISEILKQIPTISIDNNGRRYNSMNYTKIYDIIKRLVRVNSRIFNKEITIAIIPHIQQLNCYDSEHLQAILSLFDCIDFSLLDAQQFTMIDFLMSILIKENLSVKIHNQISAKELDIIINFLHNTKYKDVISPALSTFIETADDLPSDKLLLDKSQLSGIQLEYFIRCPEKLSSKGFVLFYNCIKYIDPSTNHVYLRQEALDEMKKEIMNHPDLYFQAFIRTGVTSNPEFNTVSPEPFYKQIFGSNENFEAFLYSFNNTECLDRVRKFWLLYKKNNYKPIEFNGQGNVQDKINNSFRDEVSRLKH